MTNVGDQLYEALEPLARQTGDATNGAPLRSLATALGTLLQVVVDLSEDTPQGPGWSAIMDVDGAPTFALPWLAQLVGVRLPAGETDAQQRDRIRNAEGFKRGTPAAMVSAAQRLLTGTKTVFFRERDGGAYRLSVWTRLSETADPAAVEAALREQKPAGIILTYAAIADWTLQDVYDTFATFQDIYTTYATLQGLALNAPGT